MDFGIGSVTAITAICYLGGMACKATTKVKDEVIGSMRSDRWYPGSSGYVPYAGVSSNGCDQRCSYWYCIGLAVAGAHQVIKL